MKIEIPRGSKRGPKRCFLFALLLSGAAAGGLKAGT